MSGSLCPTCGEDFAGDGAFDAHRIGKYQYTYWEGLAHGREDGRRCLTVEELELEGFVRNSYGRWTKAMSLARGRSLSAETSLSRRGSPTAVEEV